ncbi:hypothetical protein L7F22_039239 [Adiantum nelumboides]|nr:hypothetical protein [Adiantum nelumboides]
MSSSRSHVMKHPNNSGSVRFHPSVEEIESKGAGDNDDVGRRSSSNKELKSISGRRATGYTPPTDDLDDERRQIRQLMSERKINYNQHSSRSERSGTDRVSTKKKVLEANNTEDASLTSSANDQSEINAMSKQSSEHCTKQGFGAKLVGAMRFGKKHDHAGHDMDHSSARRSTLHKSTIESGSDGEYVPPEKSKYVTPSYTEAFAPIFADGHGMFLPSTAREGNSHNFHKNLANLPKGNSSFAAIVQSAVQNQVVVGESRTSKKSKKSSRTKHEDLNSGMTEDDLEKIISEAVRERLRFLAASAKRRVRDSALKVADSLEEPEGNTSRSGSRRPSLEQEKQKTLRNHELPRRQNSRKLSAKVHYLPDEVIDHDRRHEGRERKEVTDEPLPCENDRMIDAKTAFKIVEAEGYRNKNSAAHSEVVWIGRDGNQIDDPIAKKSKVRQRQLTKMPMPMPMPMLDGAESAAVHDEPLTDAELVQKNKESRADRHNERHGRPSLDSVRSEPQHRPTRERSRSRHHPRVSEDNLGSEYHHRASEDIPRSHGSSRHHRSRHERSHRSRDTNSEENGFSQLDRAKTDESLRHHQRRIEEKERDRGMSTREMDRSNSVRINEREKHSNDNHALKQTRTEEADLNESSDNEVETNAVNHSQRFKSLRALGHAIALGNSMHGGKKADIKSEDVLDPESVETKDPEGSEHANGDTQNKYNKFVDAHGETRLNEALDIAKMMMEQELLEVKAEKRRHQTNLAALDPNASQKGVKGAFKAVKSIGHNSHHDGSGRLSSGKANRSRSSHIPDKKSTASAPSDHHNSNPADDAYEQALRDEIKSKKERIKTSHFINDQNFGINGLV